MTIRTAPCEWPLLTECSDLDALVDGENTALRDAVVAAATAHLWNWTGRAFGVCDVTVRPCREDCYRESTYRGAISGAPFRPVLVAGEWRNVSCWGCGAGSCSCAYLDGLQLPGPVDSIGEVRVDGAVVPPASYRVDDHTFLVRTDGERWPVCQDLDAPLDEATFVVSYQLGIPVPEGGQIAAGLLACQMAKAVLGDKACKLPVRIQTITREGVTVSVLDAFEDLEKGRTGVWLVDSWVASMNRDLQRSRVVFPQPRQRFRRSTYTGGA